MVASKTYHCVQEYRKSDKPLECLGKTACEIISRVMKVQFASRKRKGLPAGCPEDLDGVMFEFLTKQSKGLAKRLDKEDEKNKEKDKDGKGICDQDFEKYVGKSVYNFFEDYYTRTADGHLREVLRKRLERDKRCEHSKRDGQCWKHVECPDRDTTVSTAYLIGKASKYPFKFTPANQYPDDPEKETRPRYGKRGELGNMLAGVLLDANGWTRMAVLFDVFKSRLPAEAKAPTYYIGDLCSEDWHTEASVVQHSLKIERLLLEADEHRDDPEWKRKALLELSAFSDGIPSYPDAYDTESTEEMPW